MRHDRNSARLAEDDPSDPIAVDWGSVELPDAWPDTLDLRRPSEFVAYWRGWFGARRKVELPAGMPGSERGPQELIIVVQHIQNGFY
jgi:hypothetical protein